jgi:hypothetical protein
MKFKGLVSAPAQGWLALSCLTALALAGCNKTSPSASPFSKKGKEYRLEWNLKTLVEPYEKIGHKSHAWDAAANRALTEFARVRAQVTATNEDGNSIISASVVSATEAGCDDPMVHYLYIRFGMDQSKRPEEFASEFCQTARDMDNSSYPNIRKFYAAVRARDQILYTYRTNSASRPEYGEMWNLITKNQQAALEDASMPAEEAYEACDAADTGFHNSAPYFSKAYPLEETAMFEHWPNAATTWLWKGQSYVSMAWLARGGGYSDKVSEDAFKSFFEKLAVAEDALSNAWRLDPKDARIPTLMIRVDEGLQRPRDVMETWFNRAMACDPDNYDACSYKLHYLYPQWYGSREDMLAFGRECVASKEWGGTVPLILVDAHYEYSLYLPDSPEKTDYWKQPDVWPDVKSAYDRFFELYPAATGKYNNYAWYAYRCEQWDAFLELLPKIDPVDYAYFGGQDEFDSMVQQAKAHAAAK